METSGQNNKKGSSLKRTLKTAAIIAAYTTGAMYVGDKADFEQELVTPTRDWILQTETADDFAPYSSIDLVTTINEANQRETYLRFEKGDHEQRTPIGNNGYASPDLTDRVENYFSRKASEMSKSRGYKKLKRLKDKVEVGAEYYSIKIREFFDNMF